MKWLVLVFALLSTSVVTSTVVAQESEEADPEEDRASAFRAVTGAEAEQVPGGSLLIGAYGSVFLLMLGYVWRLGRLHAANADQLARLGQTLEASKSDSDPED